MLRSVYISFIVVCIFFGQSVKAQENLSLIDYLSVIRDHYPLIKKANLFDEFAQAYDLKAKGVLDPGLSSSIDRKRFDNKEYYSIWESSVKIPTRLPLDFSMGHEQTDGLFLNPENSLPGQGLVYATAQLSLLRGLMFDEQRFQIQMAELKGIKSQLDKDLLTREIIIQAIDTYIEWASSYYALQLYATNLQVVTERHGFIIELVENGDKAAVDTLESLISINSANKDLLEKSNDLVVKQQKLDMFLWDAEGRPLRSSSSVVPDSFDRLEEVLNSLIESFKPNFKTDPSVRKLQNTMDQLSLSNKLEREKLKPQLDLKYNALVNLGDEQWAPSVSANDYKYGVQLQVPLRNRKTRSALQMNDILIEQTRMEQISYEQSLLFKYEALNRHKVIQEELNIVISEKIENSQQLMDAENMKFNLGESSVFLLNQRQQKLLESQMELIKSNSQLYKYLNELYFLRLGQI